MPSASDGPGATVVSERPDSAQGAAEVLGAAAQAGRRVRIVGGATKLDWGNPVDDVDVELHTTALDRLVEHNEGDLTAVLQAGVTLDSAQEAFARAGQMLALDPPRAGAATIGGLVASGDSGPMRHRHGAVRDLILGITAALPDGRLARAGGRVIKNVAGYDLAKLLAGSHGTLGAIVEVVLRLHARPVDTATAVGHASAPASLATAAAALARAPLELLSLDMAWEAGRGAVLARAGGSAACEAARAAGRILRDEGLNADLLDDDEELWARQRAVQRAGDGATVLKVSGLPTQLRAVVEAARDRGGRAVGRAALGLSWLVLPPAEPEEAIAAVTGVRALLAPSPCVVLDAPAQVRAGLDPWGMPEGPELELVRRLKVGFDPQGTCNPGLYVGGT